MIMTIDGEIRLKDVPKDLMLALTSQLTIQNPAYTGALRMGLPLYGIPRKIMLYQVQDNELIIPRGLWLQVWRQRPAGTVKRNFTVTLPPVSFPRADIKLRDYQDRVAQGVLDGGIPQGVVVMPCGGGKTETGLYFISQLHQPTLWITHTHDLVQQAADRARERLGLAPGELGIYSAGREEIGTHLTIATVQTLYNRDLEELGRCFGCVVVDECHRVVNNPEQASMFSAVLAQLPAKYRFGLTASAYRTDGLTDTIYHVLGEKLAEVDQDELNRKGNVVTPSVLPLVTRFQYQPAPGESPINFTRLQRCLTADTARTEAIAAYMGYTRFSAERDGLHAEATYLVSPLKNVMLWHLELRSDCDRNVTIYPYVELGMMEFMRELQWQCYNKHQLSVYEKDGVLIYRYGVENQPKPDETPLVYFASDAPAAGFDCDRDEFVGSYRSEEAPIGLEHEHLKNSTLFGGDPCFALELPLTLRAGEAKSVNIYLGTELTGDEIFRSLAACKAPDFFAASMQKLAETWEDFFSGFQCSLPDKDAETMINIWNPYQMERNFRFSRNISYYATGTFRGIGVRDTAQDVLAMIPLQLDRAKEKFELLLTQQYQDGHCNHYFFPTEGWEPVTRVHSDNHLWLVMDAYHIALEEGNVSYLDTQAPYFDGGSGTIWEHIKQSIRFTTQNMGAHGFPLMLSSDWNDMLYKVCRKGKGESIWTGMQFAVALRMMQELAERKGEPEFAEECKALYARQQELCRTLAWDGAWFRRCITDEGRFIGSKSEPQAKIWLNTQSWAVLSGLGTQEQQIQAMDSVKEYLDTDLGIKKIHPAMTTDYPTKEENLTCYNKGCGENGSVFCHANTFRYQLKDYSGG